MTDAQQQRAMVEDLVARTGALAEAANRAVDGLDPGDDELVGAVIAQLHSVNDECARIQGELKRVSGLIAPRPQPAAAEPPAPVAYEGTGGDPDAPPSEGIRLLATQMAVAGETVGDIERRLRTDFGVTNAAQVVRELFGPSGDPL